MAWDNVAWVGPWDVDVDDVHAPVRLWYGGADTVISTDHGRWLAGHLHDAELQIHPGEGHLHLLRHWSEMLRFFAPATAPGAGTAEEGGAAGSARHPRRARGG